MFITFVAEGGHASVRFALGVAQAGVTNVPPRLTVAEGDTPL